MKKYLIVISLLLLFSFTGLTQIKPLPQSVINDYARSFYSTYRNSDAAKALVYAGIKRQWPWYDVWDIEKGMQSIAKDKEFREATFIIWYNHWGPIEYYLNLQFSDIGMHLENVEILTKYVIAKGREKEAIEAKKEKERQAQIEKENREREKQERIEEERRKKAELAQFLLDRKTITYPYKEYYKNDLQNINNDLQQAFSKLLAEKESNIKDFKVNVRLHIDTNSITTYSANIDNAIPSGLEEQINSIIKKIKLQSCKQLGYTVNAQTSLTFTLSSTIDDFSIDNYKDGLFLKAGNEDHFFLYKGKIIDDLEAKGYPYGSYKINFQNVKVNELETDHISYLSFNGLGKASNALFSVIVPGLGNKFISPRKSSVWYLNTIGVLGLAGTGAYLKIQSQENYKKYHTASSQNEIDTYYNDANRQNKLAYQLMGAAAVWWIYDIVKVAVKGGENAREIKRTKTQINATISPLSLKNNTYGLNLKINF